MTPSLKLLGIAGLLLAFLVAGYQINRWRERSTRLDTVQQDYANYRANVVWQNAERDRREQASNEISKGYLAALQKQEADLSSARKRLASVRLRTGTCPPVPTAAPVSDPASSPDAAGGGELPTDAAADLGSLAARCDAVAARLNALQAWVREVK
jgi:hypothetical protein